MMSSFHRCSDRLEVRSAVAKGALLSHISSAGQLSDFRGQLACGESFLRQSVEIASSRKVEKPRLHRYPGPVAQGCPARASKPAPRSQIGQAAGHRYTSHPKVLVTPLAFLSPGPRDSRPKPPKLYQNHVFRRRSKSRIKPVSRGDETYPKWVCHFEFAHWIIDGIDLTELDASGFELPPKPFGQLCVYVHPRDIGIELVWIVGG